MTSEVSLREVHESDLPIFYENQRDLEAIRMAAVPPREHDAFMAHWAKILADTTNVVRTITYRGEVAGHVCCWEQEGNHNTGYWLGKSYWGQGIASAALAQLLLMVKPRPLRAAVAKHNAASLRVLQKCGFTIVGEERINEPSGEASDEFILLLGEKSD